VSLLLATKFTNQKDNRQQAKELKILTILSTVQTIFFMIVALVNFIYTMIMCFKRKQTNNQLKVHAKDKYLVTDTRSAVTTNQWIVHNAFIGKKKPPLISH